MAQIIIMEGPGIGNTFKLGKENIIGKAKECNIKLQSDQISNKHIKIQKKNGKFFISPLSIKNVQVNNQSVRKERELIHGDMITLGNIMLLYGEEESKEPITAAEQTSSLKKTIIESRQLYYENADVAFKSLEKTKDVSHNMEVLLKVSNIIMSKLELKGLLNQILEVIFQYLPADRGTIFLKAPQANKLWPMASKKRANVGKTNEVMASRTIIKEVLDTKAGVLTNDAMEDERFQMGLSIAAQEIHAAICVPIVNKNKKVLGIINIDVVRSDKVFTEDHLRLITGIAMQSALAIENALLIQQLGETKRIEQELTIASNIQMELLPKKLPSISGISVYGLMKPAKEVGGDYYDFIVSEDNAKLYTCIGDVSGKGVPAGLVMVMARCFFHPLIISYESTKKILGELNRLLANDMRKDMFMSMLVMKWDALKKIFTWTGAGHEHILIYRAKTKKCETIRAGGIVLGMLKSSNQFLKEQQLKLEKGDAIILYTDGVTECNDPKGNMLGLKKLVSLVERYGESQAKEICDSIFNDLVKFMGKAPQYDDITLVGIKRI